MDAMRRKRERGRGWLRERVSQGVVCVCWCASVCARDLVTLCLHEHARVSGGKVWEIFAPGPARSLALSRGCQEVSIWCGEGERERAGFFLALTSCAFSPVGANPSPLFSTNIVREREREQSATLINGFCLILCSHSSLSPAQRHKIDNAQAKTAPCLARANCLIRRELERLPSRRWKSLLKDHENVLSQFILENPLLLLAAT